MQNKKRYQTDSVIYTVGRLRQRLELWGTLQVKYKVWQENIQRHYMSHNMNENENKMEI